MQNFRTISAVDCQTYELIKLTSTVTPRNGGPREAISEYTTDFDLKNSLTGCLAGVSILVCHGINAYYFSWMKTNDCFEE